MLCYLIKSSYDRVEENSKLNKDSFTSRNDSQVFFLKTLSLAYMEVICFLISSSPSSSSNVLIRF